MNDSMSALLPVTERYRAFSVLLALYSIIVVVAVAVAVAVDSFHS